MDKETKWYIQGACEKGYVNNVINYLNKGHISKESGSFLILMRGKYLK